MTKPVIIYIDGSCLGNPGPGGWAAFLSFGNHTKEISGGYQNTTNNRMELQAAIFALKALKKPCKLEIYTDSSYLKQGITDWVNRWQKNGWRTANKKSVKNKDLWQELIKEIKRHEEEGIQWHWVKAHADNEFNNRVDQLARQAAKKVNANSNSDQNLN